VSQITVSQVVSRKDRDAFIKFPWQIYRDDPAWVPPLLIERKAFLDRKRHPFYRHGDATLFLAKAMAKSSAASWRAMTRTITRFINPTSVVSGSSIASTTVK
jgi:hypothetical protein